MILGNPPWLYWDDSPSEVLDYLIAWIPLELTVHSVDELESEIKKDYLNGFDSSGHIYNGTYKENVTWCNKVISWDMFHVSRFYCTVFPYNKKLIHKHFSSTEIIPIALEALGIYHRLREANIRRIDIIERHTYYKYWDKQDVIKICGEEELKYYKPDMEPTEEDYKIIYLEYLDLIKYIQKIDAVRRLDDLAARVQAYKDHFFEPLDSSELEIQNREIEDSQHSNINLISLNEKQKKVLSYLSKRPKLIQYQADIESWTEISRKTVGSCLNRLMLFQLVKRPDMGKNGYEITQEGLNWLKENP